MFFVICNSFLLSPARFALSFFGMGAKVVVEGGMEGLNIWAKFRK